MDIKNLFNFLIQHSYTDSKLVNNVGTALPSMQDAFEQYHRDMEDIKELIRLAYYCNVLAGKTTLAENAYYFHNTKTTFKQSEMGMYTDPSPSIRMHSKEAMQQLFAYQYATKGVDKPIINIGGVKTHLSDKVNHNEMIDPFPIPPGEIQETEKRLFYILANRYLTLLLDDSPSVDWKTNIGNELLSLTIKEKQSTPDTTLFPSIDLFDIENSFQLKLRTGGYDIQCNRTVTYIPDESRIPVNEFISNHTMRKMIDSQYDDSIDQRLHSAMGLIDPSIFPLYRDLINQDKMDAFGGNKINGFYQLGEVNGEPLHALVSVEPGESRILTAKNEYTEKVFEYIRAAGKFGNINQIKGFWFSSERMYKKSAQVVFMRPSKGIRIVNYSLSELYFTPLVAALIQVTIKNAFNTKQTDLMFPV